MLRLGLLLAVPVVGLAGCADLPFMRPARSYVVFFQTGSAALRAPGLAVIAKAARVAANDADAPVTVTGAADIDGNTPDNVRLSNARAASVAAQLLADGVASSRIGVQGLGPMDSPPASEQASRTATIDVGR